LTNGDIFLRYEEVSKVDVVFQLSHFFERMITVTLIIIATT